MADNILIPRETESIVKNGLALLRLSRFFGFIKSLLDDHRLEVFALTDEANIPTDCSEGSVFPVTLGSNRTLDNPTNKVLGKEYTWIITQDATGGRTLSFGTDFNFDSSPVIDSEINAVTIIKGIVIDSTTIRANIFKYDINQVFALTDGANIPTDCEDGSVFPVTLGGNRTLDNPTNKKLGKTYTWVITQDGTGSRTLAFGTDFVFTGSKIIRPSADKVTIIEGKILSSTVIQTTIVNAPGRVIQTVQEHVIITSQQALTANTRANITNLNKSITPTDDDSKILIRIKWSGEPSSQVHNMVFGIKRDSIDIGNPAAAGSRAVGMSVPFVGYWNNDFSSTPDSCFYEYLDSPGSSSTLVYKGTILSNTSQTLYNNRTVGDGNSNDNERLTSTIILMEISG